MATMLTTIATRPVNPSIRKAKFMVYVGTVADAASVAPMPPVRRAFPAESCSSFDVVVGQRRGDYGSSHFPPAQALTSLSAVSSVASRNPA